MKFVQKVLLLGIMSLTPLASFRLQAAHAEIEIKFQLTDQQRALTQSILQKIAVDKGEVLQSEHYFDDPQQSFFFLNDQGFYDSKDSLRVRMTPKGSKITYKCTVFDATKSTILYRKESETDVKDGNTMIEILENLGYIKMFSYEKRRHTYVYNNFEIVIDHMPLGTFLEVEIKEDGVDAQTGLQQIRAFLKNTLELKEIIEIDRSYTVLLKNPDVSFARRVKL